MSEPKRGAIGVDHGTKRTGFAAVDPLRIVVTPLGVSGAGDAAALDELARLASERDVATVVVGYPWNMDGTPGGRAREVDAFLEKARARLPHLAFVLQDERLSTKEAEERLRDAGHHGEDRKARRDSWSAMVLLEDWIRDGEPG